MFDKTAVQQLREESLKWVDIARILGISPKTLIRRRREFEMPIGADAFTCIEDNDLDEHVRGILRLNPDAGKLPMCNLLNCNSKFHGILYINFLKGRFFENSTEGSKNLP